MLSRHSIEARRQWQVGRPSASGRRSSRCVEWRFEVAHSSRSWRKFSAVMLPEQLVMIARSSSFALMRSSRQIVSSQITVSSIAG